MLYGGCEFVANNVAPFLQNLVGNVRLSQYVEMRDMLIDVIYIFGKLDMRGSGPSKIPNFPSGDGRVPSGLPVRQQAGFDLLFKWDFLSPWCRSTLVGQVGSSHTFNKLCREIVHNAHTEVSGSKNQLVPIVD